MGLDDIHTRATILVESALSFTIRSMVYVITYGIGSDIAFSCYSMFTLRPYCLCNIVWCLLTTVCNKTISPQVIALRVLMRRAWRKEQTADYLTTNNLTDRSQSTAIQGEPKDEHDLEKKLEHAASMESSPSRETNLHMYAA
ncbi:hypothetical protein NUW54_g7849 [Trametes sanguinea]|uniref:Uncharacterized protein n=1 Tax=Trametes sanguinea TaxID=158606 RepID=A0ACC1PIF0_9APHY|nr:hypothetical protein NUW54_g7849 [Trametes sanguinea]